MLCGLQEGICDLRWILGGNYVIYVDFGGNWVVLGAFQVKMMWITAVLGYLWEVAAGA